MVRISKFKVGEHVKIILNKYEVYEIKEVTKNKLIVSPLGNQEIKYTFDKKLFEVINQN